MNLKEWDMVNALQGDLIRTVLALQGLGWTIQEICEFIRKWRREE